MECFQTGKQGQTGAGWNLQHSMMESYLMRDNEEAVVELGYDEDYDILLSGYCRKNENDSWKEIMIQG